MTYDKKLLKTKGNTKLDKGEEMTAGLTFAPHTQSGYNVCPHASEGCIKSCVLWFAGRTVTNVVRNAAIERTKYFFEHRNEFNAQLTKELQAFSDKCVKAGQTGYVRLNVASDIDWIAQLGESILKLANLVFYDYTKDLKKIARYKKYDNYHLTYSYNENSDPQTVKDLLASGVNVALVSSLYKYQPQQRIIEDIPESVPFLGERYATTDGDKNDIRTPEKDGIGKLVILRLKGTNEAKKQAIESGFAESKLTQLTVSI